MDKNYAKYLLDKIRKDYNLISEEFSRTRTAIWGETKFLFLDYLKNGDKVLDLGCGNGRHITIFKSKDVEYTGLDNSAKLIEEARKNHTDADFKLGNALKLPFSDNLFDKIYAMAIFHHIPSKELRLKFLSEAKRVLKPNGLLILTVWKFHFIKDYFLLFKYTILKIFGRSKLDFKDFFEPWGDKAERYYHWFSKRELENLLKKSGFKIKETGIVKNKRGNRRNIYLVAERP